MATKEPQYNLNPDGTFMMLEEIVEDVIKNRLDGETKELIRSGNMDGFTRHMGLGRWIRNTYGLWSKEHPIYALWEEERATYLKDGTDSSPHHPDNYSGKIIDAIEARLQKKHEKLEALKKFVD